MRGTKGTGNSFAWGKAADAWRWPLIFIQCRVEEWVDLYLHSVPSCLAQRQLYLCFIICFSVRMTSDRTWALYRVVCCLYRVVCCLYICSENKASLVAVGTVAVVITTEIFDYCTSVNNLNRAVECQVWRSLCRFYCGWSKSTDVRQSWFYLSHPPVVCTLDTRVLLQSSFFLFLFLWSCFPDHKVRI